MLSRRDRVLGGIWGVLVGDAGGIPYENKKPEELPSEASSPDWDPFVVPLPYKRSHSAQPPNVYSDDGSQALCLLASLIERDGFEAQDFGERLVRWYDHGYLAANGTSFGSGGTTRDALARIRSGVPAAEAGLGAEENLGNGALMRALPLALWYPPSDGDAHYKDIVDDAMAQGGVTHKHPRSQVCVAAFTLWKYATVNGHLMGFVDAIKFVHDEARGSNTQTYRSEATALLKDFEQGNGKLSNTVPVGGFHVVNTFISAIDANRRARTFEDVLRNSIRFGNDTDTTAAVACGIAGISYGVDAIPKRWLEAVKVTVTSEALGYVERLGERA